MFGITLRLELAITDKTIKRYVTEAWKATKAAGIAPTHPRASGLFSIMYSMGRPEGLTPKFRADYCSIKWSYIKAWKSRIKFPTYLDRVALTIITIAFTTMRRVGTFLPASHKAAAEFSWVIPRYIRYYKKAGTMLI